MASGCCGNASVSLYACSGGSNVGQLTNEAAKALDGLGQGRMSCAIGVGAGLPSFVGGAGASTSVVLDGCAHKCVARACERAGLTPDVHIVVTDLGISKEHTYNLTSEEIALVAGTAREALATGGRRPSPASGASVETPLCGCGGSDQPTSDREGPTR